MPLPAPSDSDLPSLFHNKTVDIADRLQSMIEIEQRSQYQCRNYLHHRNRPSLESKKPQRRRVSAPSILESTSKGDVVATNIVTPALRTKIVQWLYDCVDYLNLSRECVIMAMSYVDRLMSFSRSRTSNKAAAAMVAQAKQDTLMYQLVAFSSLFLAAKQHSSRNELASVIDTCTLVRISHDCYSVKEIITMEKLVLEGLEWRLCGPTPLSIAYDAIALLAKTMPTKFDKWRRVSSVVDFTRLQIEMSTLDYDISVLRSPSTIALASIINSLELLDFTTQEKRLFSRALMKCNVGIQDDIFRSPQMEKTRNELHNVFDRQSSNVIDRAIPGISTPTASDEKIVTKEEEKKIKKTMNNHRPQSTSPSKSPVRINSDIEDISKTKRSHYRHQGRRYSSCSHRTGNTVQGGMNPHLMRADKNKRSHDSRRVPLEP